MTKFLASRFFIFVKMIPTVATNVLIPYQLKPISLTPDPKVTTFSEIQLCSIIFNNEFHQEC